MSMRVPTLPALLAMVCLLSTPCAVPAQTSAAIPMHQPSVAQADTGVFQQPLAWSSLSPEQQRVLAPVQGQWNQLQPQRQQWFATRAQHWATLPPKQQRQIRKRLTRWAEMTPAQRLQLRENARAFHDLTPTDRAKVSAAFRMFQSLSPAERRALRERWRTMPPQQRSRWASQHPDKPIPMHPPPEHQEH